MGQGRCQDGTGLGCQSVIVEGCSVGMQRRGERAPRRSVRRARPWWQNEPQHRCYFGLDTLYLFRYPAWGGIELLWRCPVSLLDWSHRPPFPEEFWEKWPMKKPTQQGSPSLAFEAPPDHLAVEYPNLAEFLTARFYEGNPPEPRLVGTLLIFAQAGVWKACLRDKQEERCLWVSAAEWADLLPLCESGLVDGNACWRSDRLSGAVEATRQKKGPSRG